MGPDVDLPDYLGKYEFSAAPRSIFTQEGNLIRSKNKSKITSEMLECLPVESIAEESANPDYEVIAFYGMAVLSKIDIKKMKLKLCSEFTSVLVQEMEKEVPGFDKVCIIFSYSGFAANSWNEIPR